MFANIMNMKISKRKHNLINDLCDAINDCADKGKKNTAARLAATALNIGMYRTTVPFHKLNKNLLLEHLMGKLRRYIFSGKFHCRNSSCDKLVCNYNQLMSAFTVPFAVITTCHDEIDDFPKRYNYTNKLENIHFSIVKVVLSGYLYYQKKVKKKRVLPDIDALRKVLVMCKEKDINCDSLTVKFGQNEFNDIVIELLDKDQFEKDLKQATKRNAQPSDIRYTSYTHTQNK